MGGFMNYKVWRMTKWNTYLEFNKMGMKFMVIPKGAIRYKVTYCSNGKKIKSEFIEGMWPHEITKYCKQRMEGLCK